MTFSLYTSERKIGGLEGQFLWESQCKDALYAEAVGRQTIRWVVLHNVRLDRSSEVEQSGSRVGDLTMQSLINAAQ